MSTDDLGGPVDGSGLAGGLIAAALLDVLIAKGVLSKADAQRVVEVAYNALSPAIFTPESQAAAEALYGMITGKYAQK